MREGRKRVYVVNKGSHDYSDAERYGEIVYLSEGIIHRHAVGEMYRLFSDCLSDSREDDFILVSGLTQMTSVAVAILAYKHGRVNMLLHDHSGRYIARDMVLGNLVDIGANG